MESRSKKKRQNPNVSLGSRHNKKIKQKNKKRKKEEKKNTQDNTTDGFFF
jgi:hypothetical protein